MSRKETIARNGSIANIVLATLFVTLFVGYDITNNPIHPVEAHEVSVASPEPTQEASNIKVSEVVSTEYKPTPKPAGTPEDYIKEVFGYEQGTRAIKMLKECENKSLKTDAVNWNRNGTWDFGLFQVNQIHGYTQDQLSDYKFNTRMAYKIYKNAGYSFSPWTCADVIGEVPFYLK